MSRWFVSSALLVSSMCVAGGAQAESRIYYRTNSLVSCASMSANGANKSVDTCGEPSYLQHGGQPWFLQLQRVTGSYVDGRGRYEVFAVSQDEAISVQLSDDPTFRPDDARWLKDDGAVSISGVQFLTGPLDGESNIKRIAVAEGVGGALELAGTATVVATAGVTKVGGPFLQSDIQSHDWAPGGNELAFQDYPGVNAGGGLSVLRRVNVVTNTVSLIISVGYSPVYSPNGAEIAFRRERASGVTAGTFAIQPNGAGLRTIVKDTQTIFYVQPSWSPDGSKLAISRQSSTRSGYVYDIYSVPAAGGKGTNLTGDTTIGAFLTAWR